MADSIFGDIFSELGPAVQRTGLLLGEKSEKDKTRKMNIILDALERRERGQRFETTHAFNQARLKEDRERADRIFKFNVGKEVAKVHEGARKTIVERDIAGRKATAALEKEQRGIETKKTERLEDVKADIVTGFGEQLQGPTITEYLKIVGEKPVDSPLSDAEYYQQVTGGFQDIKGDPLENMLKAIGAAERQLGGQGRETTKLPTQEEIEAMTPEERLQFFESLSRP